MTGLVVTWVRNRGFGFIRPDGCDDELFVHRIDLTPIQQSLLVNTRVTFDIGVYGGRKKAVNVRAVEAVCP